ncbi:hypothetical protein HY643_04400, partial [Candidatus Woesearchaeota archaeon]|nr:hypothetical protein [Candidatus Woesearchaeota archaeon]
MGLDKIFQEKAEKVEEEKKLQVITSEESVIDELFSYLVDSSKQANKEYIWFEEMRQDFLKFNEFLKSYKITPSLIGEFDSKVNHKKICFGDKGYLGVFLSSLIQNSHNQGFNDFLFKKVKAEYFGAFLHGKENNLRIKVSSINKRGSFYHATNCSLCVEMLFGEWTMYKAEDCVAEIQNYLGRNFGLHMKNCKITSSDQVVLDKLIKSSLYGTNNQ